MNEKFHDEPYLDLVRYILEEGIQKGDRTGTGTLSTFAQQLRFDLTGGTIPLLTTKKMFTRGIIHELIWFLAGDTNIKYLNDNNVHIWDEWADDNGDLGPIYGKQWRDWGGRERVSGNDGDGEYNIYGTEGIDQIARVIDQLRNNPNDRRIIVSAWNVAEIENMKLPPCHALFQFWSAPLSIQKRRDLVDEKDLHGEGNMSVDRHSLSEDSLTQLNIPERQLKCHLYQRSCDTFLGVPFNIVQYSILVHMIAHITHHVATEFVWTGGDVHLYNNHIDQANEQLTRKPFPSPILKLNPKVKEIDDFKFEDFEIVGYNHHPTIKAEVSV